MCLYLSVVWNWDQTLILDVSDKETRSERIHQAARVYHFTGFTGPFIWGVRSKENL